MNHKTGSICTCCVVEGKKGDLIHKGKCHFQVVTALAQGDILTCRR
jgi:hypothetical protein